jgi:hypothetical protein
VRYQQRAATESAAKAAPTVQVDPPTKGTTMMHLVLVIDIDGDVDQSGLERLRTHLNLKKFGRLTDDWDQQFGYRKIERVNGHYTKIVLYREFDGSWQVQVIDTKELDPDAHEFALLRDELVGGITSAGYQATVRANPT